MVKDLKLNHTCRAMSGKIIYVIQCGGYKKEYIGETGDTLRHRLTAHRQQIRNRNVQMLYVSEHISICVRQSDIKFKVVRPISLPYAFFVTALLFTLYKYKNK